jgi:adenylate cyclase
VDVVEGAGTEFTFALVDMAGFTALTEWHGDEHAAELATDFADLAVGQLAAGDRLVKTLGDAVLLAASSPLAGLGLVSRLLDACHRADGFPVVRAGLHTGPAVERGGDLFGSAVNLTARVAAEAAGGQVLSTSAVAEAAGGSGIRTESLGTFRLRNIAQPIELFALDLGAHPMPGGVDPVCRMFVPQGRAAGWLRHDGVEYLFCSLACAHSFASAPERFTP